MKAHHSLLLGILAVAACNKTPSTDEAPAGTTTTNSAPVQQPVTQAQPAAPVTINKTTVVQVPAPPPQPVYTTDQIAPLTIAPPPPQVENPGPPPVPGQIWMQGAWSFENNRYIWHRGHWESPRPGFIIEPPRWEQRNGRWERHGGGWAHDEHFDRDRVRGQDERIDRDRDAQDREREERMRDENRWRFRRDVQHR